MTASRRRILAACAALAAAAALAFVFLREPDRGPLPDGTTPEGTADARLTPDFWVGRLEDPDRRLAARAAIDAQNAALVELDDSMHDLRALPARLTGAQVTEWIRGLADPPGDPLYDTAGEAIPPERVAAVADNRNLEAVPAEQPRRLGLVVRRAALRTFPTDLRVFRSPGNTDIDRFQESAMFPGTPVAIVHESRDGQWWFVVSPRYAAWVKKTFVAEGDAESVLGWQARTPYRIVTGAKVETVFTPEEPGVSRLGIDMGVRLPLADDWPAGEAVNGQYPQSAWIVRLPVRTSDGGLRVAPALVQKNADTAGDYLPMTRANIIRQGFRFLGERYGWGHSYGARDCSGFVSEVYRSMGAVLPRNTSDQSVSPALRKRRFTGEDGAEARLAALDALDVGDLIYIPGHVMMVIGRIDGEPWIIHDTTGASYRAPEGGMVRVPLNGVSVTPFLPLRFNENERYVDRMTSIVRVAPDSDEDASEPL